MFTLPHSHAHTNSTPEQPELLTPTEAPPLTLAERVGAGTVALGGAAVGALGFYASFDAVSLKAAEWGFEQPWVLPTAIDSAIPVFTGAHLLLIRADMPLWWARLIPWALSSVTCALNVASGDSLWAKIAHGAMSLLWVAVSEIAAHTYAVRIGAATGRRRRMEKVRLSRWILAPLPTFLLWRQMKLWELRDYSTALGREQERLAYRARLRGRFGRAWRKKAPVEAVMPLILLRAGVPLSQTAAEGLRAAGLAPQHQCPPPRARDAHTAPAASSPTSPSTAPTTGPKTQTTSASLPPCTEPRPQEHWNIPEWKTEGDLYEIIKDALDNGRREVFDGPLTGNAIAKVLQQSEGNGRKVRLRLIKAHAANRGVPLPPNPTLDDIVRAFTQHPVSKIRA